MGTHSVGILLLIVLTRVCTGHSNFSFLHIADIHFQPSYVPGSNPSTGCQSGSGSAGG